MWQTFGHNPVKNILERQLGALKFPHAYLFQGPEGVGKKTLALEFAKKVLNTENLQNHADFQILDMEGEITMEPALDFMSRLSLKPFLGAKKIAIINNAQNLNLQSGNALLKTLEEPSPSTIIILVAESRKVMPTIVSRCQVLNFNILNEDELKAFAAGQNIKLSEDFLALSFGQSSRLKKLAEDEDFYSGQKTAIEQYRNIKKMPLAEKLTNISEFAELEPEALEQNLLTWMHWQSGELGKKPADYGKLQALADSLGALKKNQNKKLVLQSLFLRI